MRAFFILLAICVISPLSLLHAQDPEMVFVKGGSFGMGCNGKYCAENNRPVHTVTLGDYEIGKYEVTQKEWVAVMGRMPQKYVGSPKPDRLKYEGDNYPVVAHYKEVLDFIDKLNAKTGKMYRLPTEAEWEYAARGGAMARGLAYSGSAKLDEVAWYAENSGMAVHPVGQKAPNELGLYDMSGNVAEWCGDWFAPYPADKVTDPKGPDEGECRVTRGGSAMTSSYPCGVLFRQPICDPKTGFVLSFLVPVKVERDFLSSGYGFRLVRVIPKENPAEEAAK